MLLKGETEVIAFKVISNTMGYLATAALNNHAKYVTGKVFLSSSSSRSRECNGERNILASCQRQNA